MPEEVMFVFDFLLGFFLANLIGMNGMTGTLAALAMLGFVGVVVYKAVRILADISANFTKR